MSGGPLHVWNKWAIQILVLLSFGLQILLFILASIRRHRPSTRLRICLRLILWLAYLMADTTAVYALGHLSLSGWLPEHELVAFWAPFLLLHLGSQDNITAYALEDNQLWPRHLLTLGVQTVGVCYVLYKHMTHEPAKVVAASLMFMVGFIKYLERTWALKRATLESIRSSIEAHPNRDVPFGSMENQEGVPDEEELLLFAHHVLPTCMAALTDYSEDSGKVGGDWKGEHIGKVVEMELSLMYDILYTKATMIHHWYGYFIRVILLLVTMVALLLFHLDGKKVGHAKIDVIITYILFGGALFLDMVSLVKAAMSTWTCDLLENIGGRGKTLCKQIQSSRRRVKAASSRGWSGSVGQYNLFDASSRDMAKPGNRILQVIKLDDWWKKYQYKGTLVIPGDVKKLLFQRIWWTIHNDQFCVDLLLDGSVKLQELISIWHITTNLVFSDPEANGNAGYVANGSDARYVEAIKVISNYMMFLAVARHDMLPAVKLRSSCEKTSNDLQQIWSGQTAANRKGGFGGLLPHLFESEALTTYSTLLHGTMFAKELQHVMNSGKRISMGARQMEKMEYMLWCIMPELKKHIKREAYASDILPDGVLLKLILNASVRMLVAVSIRCSRESHAKQLSHGGELITIAWILMEHFQRPAR